MSVFSDGAEESHLISSHDIKKKNPQTTESTALPWVCVQLACGKQVTKERLN